MRICCLIGVIVIFTIGSMSFAQYIGDTDTVGTTWYDMQHSGSCGRMIRVDSQGRIHVVWMNGLESGAINRHVYYNLRNPSTGWVFGNVGLAVDNAMRSGYTTLALDSDDNPFVAFHVITSSSTGTAHAAVATIPIFAGIFIFWEAMQWRSSGLRLPLTGKIIFSL